MLGDCGGKQRPYTCTTAFQRISGRTHAMVINAQVFDRNSMDIARAKIVDLLRDGNRREDSDHNSSVPSVLCGAPAIFHVLTGLPPDGLGDGL